MKSFKKLAGLALALIMALALAVPAFAAGDNATITVENASKGEEYKLVKLFDATYNTTTKAIVYTGTVPASLDAYFQADDQGYITVKDGATGADGKLSVAAVEAITKWAEGQTGTEKEAENSLVFTGLDYGYYVVVSRSQNSKGGAISVTSTMPNGVIYDKNNIDEPGFPEDGSGKVVNNKTVAVGETVTYTITYNATNWIDLDGDKSNGSEAQVTAYAFKDSLPDFLDDVTVTSIVVTDADGDHAISNPPQFTKGYDLPLMVGWADHSYDDDMNAVYTSKYTNGAVITITYTAVVNEKILDADDANHKNEITGYPVTPDGNGPEDKADDHVFTSTAIINKFANNPADATDMSKKLAGAKFVLAREVVVPNDDETGDNMATGSYFEYCVIDNATKAVTWTTDADKATVVTTDDNGAASFAGLASGEYLLIETEAPDGYNLLDAPFEIELHASSIANTTTTANVANDTGAVLPDTGGIGTTIFYTLGGLLLVGSVILFVTKKRTGMAD